MGVILPVYVRVHMRVYVYSTFRVLYCDYYYDVHRYVQQVDHFDHKTPTYLRDRPFQAAYCDRLVSAASMTPNDSEWENALAPAVAVIPIKPASKSGQHQLPTVCGGGGMNSLIIGMNDMG